MKSVSLHTLGCKLNYSETSTIAKDFSSKGFKLNNYGEPSDIFVLNTCSVTDNADKECRQIVRSVIRDNPKTYVIVTGCYAQLQPGQIAEIEGVDLVLGINEKFKLFDYIDNFEKKELSCIHHTEISEVKDFDEAFSADTDSRTRAFLKIQDGCNYKCTFCTIPLARGISRSLPIEKVIDNAKKIIDSGYREIVLTGVNTGDYNFESSNKNFRLIDVLYELDKLNIDRIRISSIEPNLLTDDIISFAKNSVKYCKHFHIPMQSGDNDILKLMKRRYNKEFYRDLIYKLNDEILDAGIGVDVITGFPGEDDTIFENTYNFLDSLPVSYLHVFNYSERKNTEAILLNGKVDVRKRKKRSELLRRLSERKKLDFYKKYSGSVQSVLFESKNEDGYSEGYTSNYIRVRCIKNFENEIKDVTITDVNTGSKIIADCKINISELND
ncbi:MAG TPA: tRNA (N(6)-L-threonylcarbamoyladenosine(37)-C(2))-methylthiotransferase MtaB [Ignavibacteria bacterium]|nr:tRNA (N(6)-L-threonylcarbamoyladenosine(37)-C(2))-methylthiotransferase MtaB [Ignavibacteria bacterium]HMR40676.1 tRNA (N(6)-L-threonylcarbamoyladenosine(37)-C(2))-methylthiotransferase MtaB [Ignavibacteria bacterium]